MTINEIWPSVRLRLRLITHDPYVSIVVCHVIPRDGMLYNPFTSTAVRLLLAFFFQKEPEPLTHRLKVEDAAEMVAPTYKNEKTDRAREQDTPPRSPPSEEEEKEEEKKEEEDEGEDRNSTPKSFKAVITFNPRYVLYHNFFVFSIQLKPLMFCAIDKYIFFEF